MPQTKLQDAVFSLMMSFAMVYGMEVYNQALSAGVLTAPMFRSVFHDLLFLMVIVIILEKALGGVLARKLACKIAPPATARPGVLTLTLSICTVCVMCPMMSLAATVLFKSPTAATLLPLWLKTIAVNFPMAFLWQLLCAGPLVRFLFRRLFVRKSPCRCC